MRAVARTWTRAPVGVAEDAADAASKAARTIMSKQVTVEAGEGKRHLHLCAVLERIARHCARRLPLLEARALPRPPSGVPVTDAVVAELVDAQR